MQSLEFNFVHQKDWSKSSGLQDFFKFHEFSSLVNLCSRESLCDIRRDHCHHFASGWDFGRDAQRVCQTEGL